MFNLLKSLFTIKNCEHCWHYSKADIVRCHVRVGEMPVRDCCKCPRSETRFPIEEDIGHGPYSPDAVITGLGPWERNAKNGWIP